MSKYSIGAVVRLVSGGPPMTVEKLSTEESGLTRCVWFTTAPVTLHRDSFSEDLLVATETYAERTKQRRDA